MTLRYTLLTIILLLTNWLNAAPPKVHYQVSQKEKQADVLFERQSFQSAATLYEEILAKELDNERVLLKAAESYYALNEPERAERQYAQVTWAPGATLVRSVHRWHYAQVLVRAGKSKQAQQMLEYYLEETPEHQAAQNMWWGLEKREAFYADSAQYAVEPLNINSRVSDFSPAFYRQGLVFSSARRGNWSHKTYHRDLGAFLNLFYARPLSSDNSYQFDTPQLLFDEGIVSLHQGPAVFYDHDNKVIFTTNNQSFRKDRDQLISFNRLQLLYSEKQDGRWSDPVPLPFNAPEYSVGHPAISSDGTRLYFSSDQSGGFGGTDLYVSYYHDGAWSSPENLGDQVNTDGDEMFPFLHNDQTLYFASNGHMGLGGLDIYETEVANATTAMVKNLGYPINTIEDDFGLILQPDGQAGYVSSRRAGQDDVYAIRKQKRSSSGSTIELIVQVVDGLTNQPIPGVMILMNHQDTGKRTDYTTDEQGSIYLTVDDHSVFDIAGVYQGERWGHPPIDTHGMTSLKENIVTIYLYRGSSDTEMMDVVVFDRQGDRGDVLVSLGRQLYVWEEDDEQYYLKGEGRRILLYSVEPGRTQPVGLEEKIEQVFMQGGAVVRSLTIINNTYFDFDRHDIRTDAQPALDVLVEIMRRYPYLRIHTSGHTDSRGSYSYNDRLSQRRVQAVIDYLKASGTDDDRIMAHYYGEHQLVNACTGEVKCSAQEHQNNRRVEFGIWDIKATPPLIATESKKR